MTTNFQHTASRTGAVHLIRTGASHALCGRLARSAPTVNWPRWDVAAASLDVRQRRTCDACSDAHRRLVRLVGDL